MLYRPFSFFYILRHHFETVIINYGYLVNHIFFFQNSKLIDQRMTSFASCRDLQSTEFMLLMPIKNEPEGDDGKVSLLSYDTYKVHIYTFYAL